MLVLDYAKSTLRSYPEGKVMLDVLDNMIEQENLNLHASGATWNVIAVEP